MVEVVVAVNLQVVTYAAAVGGDGLVMRDAVEAEQLLQTGEVVVGDAASGALMVFKVFACPVVATRASTKIANSLNRLFLFLFMILLYSFVLN